MSSNLRLRRAFVREDFPPVQPITYPYSDGPIDKLVTQFAEQLATQVPTTVTCLHCVGGRTVESEFPTNKTYTRIIDGREVVITIRPHVVRMMADYVHCGMLSMLTDNTADWHRTPVHHHGNFLSNAQENGVVLTNDEKTFVEAYKTAMKTGNDATFLSMHKGFMIPSAAPDSVCAQPDADSV